MFFFVTSILLISMESNNGGLRSLISGRVLWESFAVAMVNIRKASHDGNVAVTITYELHGRQSQFDLILNYDQTIFRSVVCAFSAKRWPDCSTAEKLFRLLIARIASPFGNVHSD